MIIPVWGCADQLDNSWPMLVIIIMWCPIFTVLNVYYAGKLFVRSSSKALVCSQDLGQTSLLL